MSYAPRSAEDTAVMAVDSQGSPRRAIGHYRKSLLAKIVIWTHKLLRTRSNRTSPNVNPASQPPLPVELIRTIFSHLLAERDDIAYVYGFAINSRTGYIIPARNAALVAASSVCGLWLSVGREFLYSHVYISSTSRMTLFLRTIKKSPVLAGIVKRLYLLGHTKPMMTGSEAFKARKRLHQAFEDLTSILTMCPGLDSLTTVIPFPIQEIAISSLSEQRSGNWFELPLVSQRLRNLTLWGPTVNFYSVPGVGPLLPSCLELPHLEVLCLREATFSQSSVFPKLSRLRTLMLIRCGLYQQYSRDTVTLNISAQSFPTLETLEVYDNMVPVNVDNDLLRGLKRLHMLGCKSGSILTRDERIFASLPNLEHFAFGLFATPVVHFCPPLAYWLRVWIPPRLRTLTVVLHRPSPDELIDYNRKVLQSLLELVESPMTMGTRAGSLKEIVLISGEGRREDRPLFDDLEAACVRRGLHFSREDAKGFASWVTSRASATS